MAKEKIAVLGGGLGSLSTVYGLTKETDWQDRYDITVYQMGWRLGGKGASGRNMKEGMGERIEEHGLHIWFGFYNNAFRMMLDTYDEYHQKQLAPKSPFQSVNGDKPAFKPLNMVSVMEDLSPDWKPWSVYFPQNDEELGSDNDHWTPWTLMKDMLAWAIQILDDLLAESPNHPMKAHAGFLGKLEGWVESSIRSVEGALLTVAGADEVSLLHLAEKLMKSLGDDPQQHTHQNYKTIDWLLSNFRDRVKSLLDGELKDHTDLRRFFITADLASSIFRGAWRDGVFRQGWDVIDKYDFREWLKRNGCSSEYSAPIRAAYSLVFAYEGGDIERPNFAAGACTRAFARILFTYKGSILWKMQAGMGDIVFSPLYMVLKEKGVKFKFFHCVKDIKLNEEKDGVGEIEMDIQATMNPHTGGQYDPLVWVKDCPCWPSEPLYDQIQQGNEWIANGYNPESFWCAPPAADTQVLRQGDDFDTVVLGISIAALKNVAGDLIDHDQRWQDMVENVKTVQTQAAQLWMNETTKQMGWEPWSPEEPNNPVQKHSEDALVGAYEEPLDTWSDMSQVIPSEAWPDSADVKSIAYFCGAMKDAEVIPPDPPPNDCAFLKEEKARVTSNTRRMLLNHIRPLWPNGTQPQNPNALDWDLLVDASGATGEKRLDAQYTRANIAPTERYVLSVAGSTQHRLHPGSSGYKNLILAGTWTYNGLNVGCVEAGVMSGIAASEAITKKAGVGIDNVFRADFPAKNYVVGGGEVGFPGPYLFPNTTLSAFGVESSHAALQRLCDQWLNKPSGGAVNYRPLLPGFVVLAGDFPMIEVNPGAKNAFGSPEIDINIGFPVVQIRSTRDVHFIDRVAWFFPYLFVDNPWATASGRESYGFFKAFSNLQIPRSANHGGVYRVETQYVDKFGHDAQTQHGVVMEVKRTDDHLRGEAVGSASSFGHVMKQLMTPMLGGSKGITLPGIGLFEEAWDFLAKHEVPFVFLKQFPSVESRTKSCHQTIVEAPLKILKFKGGGMLPGNYQLTASDFASHPIVSDMGMRHATQTCLSAMIMTVDASLELGHQVWP